MDVKEKIKIKYGERERESERGERLISVNLWFSIGLISFSFALYITVLTRLQIIFIAVVHRFPPTKAQRPPPLRPLPFVASFARTADGRRRRRRRRHNYYTTLHHYYTTTTLYTTYHTTLGRRRRRRLWYIATGFSKRHSPQLTFQK